MNTTPSSSLHSASPKHSDPARSSAAQPNLDAPTRPGAAGERALVLGGGGSTGNAWLIGVIAGLFDAGLDVTAPDLTVGTSAGATAAAQLTGSTPGELFASTLSTESPQRQRPITAGGVPAARGPVVDHLEKFRRMIAASADAAEMRRRMGAAALETDAASGGDGHARWRAIVAGRLPGAQWPERRVIMTAVDAQTGDPVEFDRDSGVDLIDAVAASTSGGGSAYAVGEGRYIDGGYRRSSENADLAAGYARVLVLSPLSGRTLYPLDWGMQLAVQVDELRAGGSRVEVIVPDRESEHMFGANAMDFSMRPSAARAGYDQGRALAESLADFWR